MKTAYKILMAGLLPVMMLGACDNIADNPEDRFIPVDPVSSNRMVVIQEFTGQRCSNCPNGALQVHSLLEQDPEGFVAVAMHPEGVTFTTPAYGLPRPGLTSAIATEYYKFYGSPKQFPYALFDGKELDNANNFLNWRADALVAKKKGSPAEMTVTASFDEATRTATAEYTVNFVTPYRFETNVVVWLVENGIVGMQIQPDGHTILRDYVHNHVLRASFNGVWGDKLGDGAYAVETPYDGTASLTLDEKWVAENCEVVAVLVKADTKEILQAAKVTL